MSTTASFGQRAEDLALAHLTNAGYVLLHRNWREAGIELDLVVRKNNFIVAVEVKGRHELMEPYTLDNFISKRQFARLRAGLHRYLQIYSGSFEGRLDLVVVFRQRGLPPNEASSHEASSNLVNMPRAISCSPIEWLIHFEDIT